MIERVSLGSPNLFVERVGSYPQTRHDPLDPISVSNIKVDIFFGVTLVEDLIATALKVGSNA
jgi:hypothetical protein